MRLLDVSGSLEPRSIPSVQEKCQLNYNLRTHFVETMIAASAFGNISFDNR